MSNSIAPFAYDIVLALDASPRIRAALPAIEDLRGVGRMLAVTLNHRTFTLHEKNVIKGTIEAHHLDHLMFSIRPSAHRALFARDGGWHDRARALLQVVFVLQVMVRYDIPHGIVDRAYLEVDDTVEDIRVESIEAQILEFVQEVLSMWSGRGDARKQFPILSSVLALLPAIRDRRLSFIGEFPSSPRSASHEYDDRQISPLDKDLFWVGFDPSFTDVPVEKPYPATKWTDLRGKSAPGRGLHETKIRYCTRCCLPETMEGISFDEIGICVPCRSSEEKMHINWDERGATFARILNDARSETYYDCMLPMSGGKDSMYQAHVLKTVFEVDALAVTHGQNWLSRVGRYNLENCLQQFDLDHLVFNMNRRVINQVARKSLGAIGDACWHCHIGAGTFPVQSALAWQVDLMCFGESIAEADGRGFYQEQTEASLFYNLEVSAKVKADDMADEDTPVSALAPWRYPDSAALARRRVRLLHLGDYFFWDEERQVEFIKRNYDWMEASVENAFKGFKSVECVMAGVHDYANFIKRGIGRATIQASTDVRRGLLTREEGFELAKEFDTQRPHALDFYLRLTGLTEDEFEETLSAARAKSAYASKLPVK